MGVPLRQQFRVARHVISNRLKGNRRFPLVLMLEPLYKCNLACPGCGKFATTKEEGQLRLSLDDCLNAVDECGAPVVSIAGGEPFLHPQMPEIVVGILRRRRFVYLCTNGVLLRREMKKYTPSPYFTFSVHLDGRRAEHDAAVDRVGVYDRAVEAIREALSRGFRVTVNCTIFQDRTPDAVAAFFDEASALGVEGITVSPGYSYEDAPRQDVFPAREQTKRLFREVLGRRPRRWRLIHSPLYLEFLAGKRDYDCTPWGNPSRNPYGWQRPCYLMAEGYARTFRELMDETRWDRYGTGRHPKCANCMAHCGYEASAVEDSFRHPLRAARASLAAAAAGWRIPGRGHDPARERKAPGRTGSTHPEAI